MNKAILIIPVAIAVFIAVITIHNASAIMPATNSTNNMTKFTDSQGRFTILVPTVWNTTGQTDRFSNLLLNTLDGLGTGMQLGLVGGSVHDPQTLVNLAVNNLPYGYSVFQPTDCMKYSIDGNKVCSYIGVQQADPNLNQAGRVVMQLVTNIKGQMYDITFASLEDSFDSMMPTFDTMIHSLHFTSIAVGNSTGGIAK